MCEWPDADDVGLDVLQLAWPRPSGPSQIFVERVAGRGVDQEEPLAAEREPLRQGQLEQVAPLVGPERVPDQGRVTRVR